MMKFNDTDLSDYVFINEIKGRGPINQKVNTLEVMGMPGEHLQSVDRPPRKLKINMILTGEDPEDRREKIDELNGILAVDEAKEIEFEDEPNKAYYGLPDGDVDWEEIVMTGEGEITFLCPDPVKYGKKETVKFKDDNDDPTDSNLVKNKGTADADPIFELKVKEDITFALVQNGEEKYNLIGEPVEKEMETVKEKEEIFNETGDELDDWDEDEDHSSGSFTKGSRGIQVESYGDDNDHKDEYHGPFLVKELDKGLEDFQLDFYVNVRTKTPDIMFRITCKLFDDDDNEIVMLRLKDPNENVIRKIVDMRVGTYSQSDDHPEHYVLKAEDYKLENIKVWGGLLRLKRKGRDLEFHTARITEEGVHKHKETETFRDTADKFTGDLKYIQISTEKYGDGKETSRSVINRIRLQELNEVEQDKTPYIAHEDDTITFDHKNDDILINGEDASTLKNFGGEFFKLKKGENQLTVYPEDSFETEVTYQPKYR